MPGLLTLLAYTASVAAGLSLGDGRHQAAALLVAVAGVVQLTLRLSRLRQRRRSGPAAGPAATPVGMPVPVLAVTAGTVGAAS